MQLFRKKTSALQDMSALRAAPWRDITQAELGAAAHVPSMISPEERQLYYWLARNVADQAGAIVDLGCFLGGSTACLAQGAAARPLSLPIHAYDRFTAGERQKRKHLYAHGVAPFEGDDVYAFAVDYLSPWADQVTLHRGEIPDIGWSGEPISLLVFDAGKRPATSDRMGAAFFPALIPGRSLLVQQDYLLKDHPWLICQIELLADALHPVARTEKNSVVFQTTRQITPRDMTKARTAKLSDAGMLSLMARACERLEAFGIQDSIETAMTWLRANPGQRAPWTFRNKPSPEDTE